MVTYMSKATRTLGVVKRKIPEDAVAILWGHTLLWRSCGKSAIANELKRKILTLVSQSPPKFSIFLSSFQLQKNYCLSFFGTKKQINHLFSTKKGLFRLFSTKKQVFFVFLAASIASPAHKWPTLTVLQQYRVGQSVESALITLAAIFLAQSAYFNNFRQKIPYFDASQQKRVLFNCFATKQCLGMLKMWG